MKCLEYIGLKKKFFVANELNITVLFSSPYVVKYYGSYFKNTDLWIVMEYCGAGSVSDIIRLRNKTVSSLLEGAAGGRGRQLSLAFYLCAFAHGE